MPKKLGYKYISGTFGEKFTISIDEYGGPDGVRGKPGPSATFAPHSTVTSLPADEVRPSVCELTDIIVTRCGIAEEVCYC